VGDRDGFTFNAPNRLYAGEDRRQLVDEIRHEDIEDSPFVLE
jgi:dTDP-4-dehydrorhamnose 3,5-epimerase